MTTLYIAGPMSGYPEYNYPAFHEAEAALTVAGYRVLNPARNPACDSWDGYMRAAIRQVLDADGLVALSGHALSAGAHLEVEIAHALRVPVLPLGVWLEAAS